MPETVESLKAAIAGVHKQASEVQRNGRAIKVSAEERMADVDKRLAELRPKALTDQAAADEYQRLIVERGRLAQVHGLQST